MWLDPNKTSPYSFYQFWLNSADADIEKFLKLFTFMDEPEIADLVARSQQAPEQRLAQRELARQVTELVHGDDAVTSAERISASLFGGDEASLQREDLKQLQLDGLPSIAVSPGDGLLNTMVAVGAAKSSGEARKLIQGRGVRLNGSQVDDPKLAVVFDDAYFGSFFCCARAKNSIICWLKASSVGR